MDHETLYEHWDKYFSTDTSVEKEEKTPAVFTGFGVEYALPAGENRNNFKKNIVDKFVEGQNFVVYC